MKIGIVGAGISGLATAFWLKQTGHDVLVLEASSRIGGYAGSVDMAASADLSNAEHGSDRDRQIGEFVIERGPNSFLDNEPATRALLTELGLESEIIFALPGAKRRFIYFEGKLNEVPLNPKTFITSDYLSWKAKRSLLWELVRPRPTTQGASETVYEFAQRHFGDEIAEKLAAPMVLGVFAGDAKQLAVAQAFPRLLQLEQENPSLIRAMMKRKKAGLKPPQIFSLKGGSESLLKSLALKVGYSNIVLNTEVVALEKLDQKWRTHLKRSHSDPAPSPIPLEFDHLVLALPETGVVRLIEKFVPGLALKGREVRSADPVVTLTMAFRKKTDFNGFGILVHRNNNFISLGILHPPDIFENRAPAHGDLFTLIMGGGFNPNFATSDDISIQETGFNEIRKILGRRNILERPSRVWMTRHYPGIVQYNVDSLQRSQEFENSLKVLSRVHINSTAFDGISVNDCIRKARVLAQKIGPAVS